MNLTKDDSNVIIEITDTGIGIAPDEVYKIFDRFYRVDKARSRETGGTGLGLSIVKGILESHGAAYGVESKVGEGSNFWFELETFRAVEEFDTDDEKDK